jgi:FixJ family two-component response regulator
MQANPVVFVLDDEEAVLAGLARLLKAQGFAVRTWTSATEFLAVHDRLTPGCLVTDVRMPGMNGLELQRALLERGVHRPIIFMTGAGDIPTAVRAMKSGAVTFLSKPIEPEPLLEAVREALIQDAAARAHDREQEDISRRIDTLTPREREVLDLVATGLLNKQIAGELGAAEKTIKVHRGRIFEKMKVATATQLVWLLSRTDSFVARFRASRGESPRH